MDEFSSVAVLTEGVRTCRAIGGKTAIRELSPEMRMGRQMRDFDTLFFIGIRESSSEVHKIYHIEQKVIIEGIEKSL